jgi:hypothetical protein
MSERASNLATTLTGRDVFRPSHLVRRVGLRTIAYWIFTLLVVFENAAGFLWAVLRIEYLRVMLGHLGYPQYFMHIIGWWQLAGAAALIAPRLPLVKEWAYAGAIFNYSAAFVSHLAVSDGPSFWAPPLVFAILTVCSWALRPSDRRVSSPTPATETNAWSWIVPAVILGLMLIVASFTLPAPPTF